MRYLHCKIVCRIKVLQNEYNCSYVDNGDGDVGLYVDKNVMVDGKYFEIEILSLGRRGTIGMRISCIGFHYNLSAHSYHTETEFFISCQLFINTRRVNMKINNRIYLYIILRYKEE
jgi:hypothetical protein